MLCWKLIIQNVCVILSAYVIPNVIVWWIRHIESFLFFLTPWFIYMNLLPYIIIQNHWLFYWCWTSEPLLNTANNAIALVSEFLIPNVCVVNDYKFKINFGVLLANISKQIENCTWVCDSEQSMSFLHWYCSIMFIYFIIDMFYFVKLQWTMLS